MTELAGLVVLAIALGALAVAGSLGACCLRLRSPGEFVLAAYVLAWTWLVLLALALSPVQLVTREWLLAGFGVGLGLALLVWSLRGRPPPPPFGPTLAAARHALRTPILLVLAVGVALGVVYSLALALFVPANDGDALAYHLARAAFWKQEHQLGYIANAVDLRLDINPPNAEIGQLATMVFASSDRYVALPQLAAYAALVLCVAVLARRIGLGFQEALFGALVFATLPVVLVQASSSLNDLVVASFLAIAAVFALRPGRASLVLVALAIGLAVGTKFTAPLALPALALVAAVARPRRDWAALIVAGLAGLALGSAWYGINLAETGKLDGGLAETADQRVDLGIAAITAELLRLLLDLIDMSGAPRPHYLVYPAVGFCVAAVSLVFVRRSVRLAIGVALTGAFVASIPVLMAGGYEVGHRVVYRAWVAFDRPGDPLFGPGWNLNVVADPALSWYGPAGVLLLVVGAAVVIRLRVRGRLPSIAVGLALAPLILVATLALTIVWDPYRGRFLIFGFVLAAATWGVFARTRIAAGAVAAVALVSLGLSLANYVGKPSGLGEIWPPRALPFVPVESIWGVSRADAQTRLRPESVERILFRRFEELVPGDAAVAVGARENDYLSPYFGARLSRHVDLVDDGAPPVEAEWLVVAPRTTIRRCPHAWRLVFRRLGWVIERRVAPDDCLNR